MTLIKFEPMRELESLQERLQKYFGEFPGGVDLGYAFNPRVDISQDNDKIVVDAELPGFKKENLKISLEDNILTISGEKKDNRTEEEKAEYCRCERKYGSFSRSFTLPEKINPDEVDAAFEDGVLRIVLKKAVPEHLKERTIEIK